MATVEYAHISMVADNVPTITGTRTKVRMIAMDHLANGWDGLEIQRQHPYLTLGQIHGALAYYYDHKAEMDAEIAEDLEEADRLIGVNESLQDASRLIAKLKASGRAS